MADIIHICPIAPTVPIAPIALTAPITPLAADSIQISFAKSAYSSEALNRAAYKVAHIGVVRISETSSSWEVNLTPCGEVDLRTLNHEFHVNLTDESLRESIRSRTEHLRSLILAHAYSNTRIAGEDTST